MENHFEDPQFIVSFDGGCFTYLPVTKYELNYASNYLNDMQLLDELVWDGNKGVAKQFDSIDELKEAVIQYSRKYVIPEVSNYSAAYETREQALDYLKRNYGVEDPETGKIYYSDSITRLSDTAKFKNIIESIDAGVIEGKLRNKSAISKINTNSGPVRDTTITVYEVHEVIESPTKQPSELSLLLERRFGVSREDVDLLPNSDLTNYQYIGRKKNVGGRWVNFSLDSVEFYNEIGYTVDGWDKDLVLGFVSKKRDEKIPDWRLEMTPAKLKTMFRNYIRNPLTNHFDFTMSRQFINEIKKSSAKKAKSGTRQLTNPVGDYNFRLNDLFAVLDRHKLWTKDIINDCFKELVSPGSNVFINNYSNAKPTANILKLTLADTEDKLEELGLLGVISNRMLFIQEWIVNNFANDLPISYVYELISYPGASEQVKALVKILETQLDEFIDYQGNCKMKCWKEMLKNMLLKNIIHVWLIVKRYCDLKHPKV